MFGNMVVAIDGSDCAERAFEIAVALGRSQRAELAICCVVDPTVASWTVPSAQGAEQVIAIGKKDAAERVKRAAETARMAGLVVKTEVFLGVAYEEILKFAKHQNADVIVMGTHGRSGIQRFFVGSVAEAVLRQSSCPVIVAKNTSRAQTTPAPLPEV